jgi:hypothetical protein
MKHNKNCQQFILIIIYFLIGLHKKNSVSDIYTTSFLYNFPSHKKGKEKKDKIQNPKKHLVSFGFTPMHYCFLKVEYLIHITLDGCIFVVVFA